MVVQGWLVCYRIPCAKFEGHSYYRFPTFIGEAADKTVPKDAEIPEHRKGHGPAVEEA